MGDSMGGGARRRALTGRESLLAAALFALFVLVYLWPALVGGKMLSPLASLYGYVPWKGLEPSDVRHYANPLLLDVPTADYPWRVFARELIRAGTFPAWNPHVFAGIPFFANPQTMVLSPFSLPLWLLPLHYAVGLEAALVLWTAAFGTYLLVRELGLRFLPGLLAGVAYALCSFHVVWLTHGSLPAVSALLPWMLWLVERIVRRGTLGPALGLALATAVALTGGHPGAQVHVLGAAGLYAVLRIALAGELSAPARWRRLALAGGGVAAGIALVAVMFVPELLSSRGTLGTHARAGGGELPGTHMPLGAGLSTLFPDWWGRPSAQSIQGPEFHPQPGVGIEVTFNERTFFAGVVTLALAGVALLTHGRRRAQVPFVVLGVLALAIPLHAPGVYQLVEHLPGFSLVQNQRMHVVFELSAAVLAAFGLDALLSGRVGRRALLAPALLLLAVAVAVISLHPRGDDVRQVMEHFLTGANVNTARALSLTSVAWAALLAAAVGVALLAMRRWQRRLELIAAVLVLLVAFDMLRFTHGYQPMGDPAKMIPPTTPAVRFLERHRDEGRVVGLDFAFPNDWTLVYGMRDVRGYDPPYPSLRFYRLWLLANPGQEDWSGFAIGGLQGATQRVMNALGARWVVTGPGTRLDPLASPGVRAVYRGHDATVFENTRAAPRAFVPQTTELAEGEQAADATLVADSFDVRRMAVVEQGTPGATALVAAPPVHGHAAVVHEDNARVELHATLDRRGLVILDDALYDGWRVQVDGRSAPVVRVDSVLRGVVVPAGTHRVVWTYTVPGMRLGAFVSLLTLLALVVAAVLSRRRAGTPARGSSLAGEASREAAPARVS